MAYGIYGFPVETSLPIITTSLKTKFRHAYGLISMENALLLVFGMLAILLEVTTGVIIQELTNTVDQIRISQEVMESATNLTLSMKTTEIATLSYIHGKGSSRLT